MYASSELSLLQKGVIMANFDTGVASYIHAQAVVDVYFPVDSKGIPDISCNQCFYYRRSYQTCGLNGEVCAYPNKYVGACCPLKSVDESDGD